MTVPGSECNKQEMIDINLHSTCPTAQSQDLIMCCVVVVKVIHAHLLEWSI